MPAVPRATPLSTSLAQRYTQQLRADPNFKVPKGYVVIQVPAGSSHGFQFDGGPRVVEQSSWLMRHPWAQIFLVAAAGTAAAAIVGPTTSTILPATGASMAETAAIVNGSQVPASLAAVEGGGGGTLLGNVGGAILNRLKGNGNGNGIDPLMAALLGGSTLANLIAGLNASGNAKEAAQIQADAAKYAADLQAKATAEALGFLKQQDAQNRENQAPWLRVGQGAIGKLGFLTGIGDPNSPNGVAPSAAPAPAPAPTPLTNPTNITYPGYPPGTEVQLRPPPPGTITTQPVPGGRTTALADVGAPQTPHMRAPGAMRALGALGDPAAVPAINASTYGPMVTMRAPNGQVQDVPADQVKHYTELGAVVIDEQEAA
jgi:hypothetical protein